MRARGGVGLMKESSFANRDAEQRIADDGLNKTYSLVRESHRQPQRSTRASTPHRPRESCGGCAKSRALRRAHLCSALLGSDIRRESPPVGAPAPLGGAPDPPDPAPESARIRSRIADANLEGGACSSGSSASPPLPPRSGLRAGLRSRPGLRCVGLWRPDGDVDPLARRNVGLWLRPGWRPKRGLVLGDSESRSTHSSMVQILVASRRWPESTITQKPRNRTPESVQRMQEMHRGYPAGGE